jgi:PKD repeat protein
LYLDIKYSIMKKLILTALFISFLAPALKSQPAWQKINTGYNYILRGIAFPEGQELIGFTAGESLTYMGDGIVLKTTNGGNNWTSLWTGTAKGIEGMSFPDLNTGYVGGWSGYFAKTSNGGSTWTAQTVAAGIDHFTDVVFKDADHGIATAQTNSGGAVYFTSNGGSTWTVSGGVAAIPYGACHSAGNTYFLADNAGNIQRSTNNGLSWTTVYAAGGLLLGIDFYDANTGIAAGEDGRIVKTYNGGITWQQQVIANAYPLWHSFAWFNQDNVFVCGTPEMVYRSVDGGSTWTDDYPQTTFNPAFYDIIFTAGGTGYICGSQGWIMRRQVPVTAAFQGNPVTVCEGEQVQFTDQSTGSPTSWLWTFEGGTPATSTLQNPVITYETAGIYDVSLTVSKGTETSSTTHADMVTVSANPEPAVTGLTEVCINELWPYQALYNAGSSYQWEVTGGSIATGQGSNQVEVLWGGAGTGNLGVTETSSQGCYGVSQAYPVAISECTSIAEAGNERFSLYPNPVKDKLVISSREGGQNLNKLIVTDAQGHLLIQKDEIRIGGSEPYELNTALLQAGGYILRLIGEEESFTATFVKQ